MCRILFISCLLSFCFSSVYSQDIRDKIVIEDDDVVIINQDTLEIDRTGIDDVFTRFQIDSMTTSYWGNVPVNYRSATVPCCQIKGKYYEANYQSSSNIALILNTISIKNIKDVSLFFGDVLIDDKFTHKDIQDLGFKKEQRYKQIKNEVVYKKEGIHLKVNRNSDSLSVESIHIHPKSWDKKLKLKKIKGEVSNNEGEILSCVMFLAYSKYDSLKYYETTRIDGKYYFEFDSVKSIEICSFNYESQTLTTFDKDDQTINFELKKKTYFLPDLIVSKKGEIEIDSTSYLEQFPKVRDLSNIKVINPYGYRVYNPLDCVVPSADGYLKRTYLNLITSLRREKKLRKCAAEIHLTIDKNGLTKLNNITCDDKINKETLASSIIENLKWAPVEWGGGRIDSYWTLKIIFE